MGRNVEITVGLPAGGRVKRTKSNSDDSDSPWPRREHRRSSSTNPMPPSSTPMVISRLPSPTNFSSVNLDPQNPQIAMQGTTPEANNPTGSSSSSGLGPYNAPHHSRSDLSLAPHMTEPSMVYSLAQSTAAHQDKVPGAEERGFLGPDELETSRNPDNHQRKKTRLEKLSDRHQILDKSSSLDEPHEDVDRNGGIVATQVLIAAEGASKYVCGSRKEAEIKAALLDLQISESEYLVLAGFNEDLIQTGFGYLEEIHIFCSVEIPNLPPSLNQLGKVLTPYPGIIFTPSSVYKTPVFKDDGAIWDYDDLSLDRAERHSNILAKGISRSELVPVTSLAQSQPSSSSIILGRSGGGGNNNHGGTGEDKGNSHSDDHNNDRERNGNSDDSGPDGDPEDPEGSGNGDSSMPGITFDVQAKLLKGTSDLVSSEPFQVLEIKGTLAVQTNLARLTPKQLSKSHVKFRKLSFQSRESYYGLAYQQFHAGVEIDANDKNTDIDVLQPFKTPARDHKTTETTTNNVTTNGTFGGSLAVMPTLLLSGTRSRQEFSGTTHKFGKHHSRITEWHSGGIVSWGFHVNDPIEQRTGITIGGYRALPRVYFRFYGTSDVGPPPPPPERFDVTITSSWSLTPPSTHRSYITSGWMFALKRSKAPLLYSNLCQVVKLQLPSDRLQETYYRSVTVTEVNQFNTKIVEERPALYRITPTVDFLDRPPV
ncbi:hypothetical protein BYT27DRAFT_7154915 [Phlegmacium glaucopus]|nr:hypothetical protein BYT27DRAFT_7154915 [Phlegmacium glaucopus]